ncbi:MAG: hypothetical protein ABIK28_16040 [Planctomycetota bacterium]
MSCNLVIAGPSIDSIFAAIKKAIREEARTSATQLAMDQRKNVAQRTARGIGEFDGTMLTLSDPYARRKAKLGKQSFRDLRLSGDMIRDMQANGATKTGEAWLSTVTFKTARSQLIAQYNQRRSPWFGVSPNDKTKLMRWMNDNFGARLAKRIGK